MKFTNAISLAAAPVALAKVVRNEHPEAKRDPNLGLGSLGVGVGAVGVSAVNVAVAPIIQVAPIVGVSPLLLLYTNVGGGAANQIINSQVTVTQTVQVPAGGQPTVLPDVNGGTQTIQPGASQVMVGVGATHTITVGGPLGKAFFPADIQANAGDTLLFNFMSQNHSVTQASFDAPCQPLAGGMDSGFMPNQDNSIVPAPQVAMQLTTTEPLWMYCAQGDHCSTGMVLSINPTLEKTHAQFQANAISTGNLPATGITGGAPAAAAPGGDIADPNQVLPPNSLPAPDQIVNDPANQPFIANTGSVSTGALTGGLVMGFGTVNADGSCNCAVQCDGSGSASAAGLPADVGLGGFGGQVAVIPMNAAGAGAQSVGSQSVGINSVGDGSVDTLSIDPLAANSIDPLAAATVPSTAGSTGLVAPDPAIVGRRH